MTRLLGVLLAGVLALIAVANLLPRLQQLSQQENVQNTASPTLEWVHQQTASGNWWGTEVVIDPGFHFVWESGWLAMNDRGETIRTPGLYEGGYTQSFAGDHSKVLFIRATSQGNLEIWKLLAPAGVMPYDHMRSVETQARDLGVKISHKLHQRRPDG